MTEFDSNLASVPPSSKPSSNVYTVLALVAVILLAAGVTMMAMKNIELAGEGMTVTGADGRQVQLTPDGGNNPLFIIPRK